MRNYILSFSGLLFILGFVLSFCSMRDAGAHISKQVKDSSELYNTSVLLTDSPAIVAPAYDFSTYEASVQLVWTKVESCQKYEVHISRKEDFSNRTIFFVNDTTYAFNCQDLIRGVVFWKVRSIAQNDRYSPWSSTSRFTLLGKINIDVQNQITRPCNGNCANCPNPCGRRPMPID